MSPTDHRHRRRLVVLAGVLLFAAARRRDTGSAEGVLSSETARRDRGPVELSEEGARSRAEVELAAVLGSPQSAAPVKVAEPRWPGCRPTRRR